jgi:hypothetical protein
MAGVNSNSLALGQKTCWNMENRLGSSLAYAGKNSVKLTPLRPREHEEQVRQFTRLYRT